MPLHRICFFTVTAVHETKNKKGSQNLLHSASPFIYKKYGISPCHRDEIVYNRTRIRILGLLP